MIGKILGGRYEILEEIGKGGMAYVYKARCIMLNRIVAIKVLRDDLEGDEEFLNRFNSEAQSAASLTHPNIVGIFDVGTDNDKHYIVMEYVEGITLKNYIAQNVNLQYEEALDIAYQIADALGAAHDKNIVHRDIKPHNILITEDKKIKVTDFGIARTGTGNTLSSNDDILGSVHYISPEQARGEAVDTRSDLYSLGIVMYEMITGRVPFDSDTPVAVAMMQIDGTAERVSAVDPDMPETVEQIIFKAISKDPDLRYQNADDIKADIDGVLDDPDYVMPDGHLYVNNIDNREYDSYKNTSLQPVKKSTRTIVTILSALTALFIVVAGVVISKSDVAGFLKSSFSASEEKVPNLIGKTYEEAQEICKKDNIKIIIEEEKSDRSQKNNTIISQNPMRNSKFDSNDKTIRIVINKIENDYVLKDYTNTSYKTAKRELEEKGCDVTIVFEESQKDDGIVLRQSPEAETKIKKGTKITFYVSRGTNDSENFRTVPYLIGKTYSKAIELLKTAELSLGSVTGVSVPASADIVNSQSIPAGSKVAKNCEINIGLSSTRTENEENDTSSESNNSESDTTNASDDAAKEEGDNPSTDNEESGAALNE